MVQVTKEIINGEFIVKVENEKQEYFRIQSSGADLCWRMPAYNEKNEFIVTEESTMFYEQLNALWDIIKKENNPYDSVYENDTFTWASEDYGLKENAHVLTIQKIEDTFVIRFWQNPKNNFRMKKLCFISFCLSGSRNSAIANAFSLQLLEYKCDECLIRRLEK